MKGWGEKWWPCGSECESDGFALLLRVFWKFCLSHPPSSGKEKSASFGEYCNRSFYNFNFKFIA